MKPATERQEDEQPNEDGTTTTTITLTEIVACPKCGAEDLQDHPTDAMDIEQLAEPPTATLTCTNPDCGRSFSHTFEGWSNYGDAG